MPKGRKRKPTPADVEARAEALGRRRKAAQAELDTIQTEAVELFNDAQEAGYPITELCEHLGVTPPALYGLVRRRESRRTGG